MIDSVHISSISRVLSNPNSIDMLYSLLKEPKSWSYFINNYGRKSWFPLVSLEQLGIIKKILDVSKKIPVSYEITEYGRWITHSCINFKKQLEDIPQ